MEVESIARVVAANFIADFHRGEAPYFSMIWEQLAARRLSRTASREQEICEIGLPFGGEESVKLITPSLILLIAGAVQRLSTLPTQPRLEEIQDALLKGAPQAGVSQTFAKDISETIGTELFARLQRLGSGRHTMESKELEEKVDLSRFTVSRLASGHYHAPKRYFKGWAERLLTVEKYDIIVDERTQKLKIGKNAPVLIRPIRRMQRGMLWLVLTHVESGYITHDDINHTFGLGHVTWNAENRRAIYQYPAELEKLVGAFYRRMLCEGKSHCYGVNKVDWSFCWILPHRDLKQSELYPERKG